MIALNFHVSKGQPATVLQRFLTRSRLYTDEEWKTLERK